MFFAGVAEESGACGRQTLDLKAPEPTVWELLPGLKRQSSDEKEVTPIDPIIF